jgi:hypothetical protein
MDLILDFLHQIALALYELLIADDVEFLGLNVVLDDALLDLFPLLVFVELRTIARYTLINHINNIKNRLCIKLIVSPIQ